MALHHVAGADYEDLRIALVMNGGVSLAVWIGGVSHEINRLVRGEDIYGEIRELVATSARVDVISGASAGGVNGALLALAVTSDTDLAPVRDVWLHRGSLDELLRSPYDDDIPSLLKGNELFFEDLRDALRRVRGTGAVRPPHEVPLDLTLTATMLRGEPSRIADDLGIVIGDVKHRGLFRFRRSETAAADPFADPRIADRLALAARASASFPVAFEPIFCPVAPREAVPDPRLCDMFGIASFSSSRYLLDGGILDNKPLESALTAIFRQPARGEVRRVLAYVVPAPGQTAAEAADAFGEVPTIGEVALASLVELPRVESISAQLEAIVEHNRLVRRKRDTRIALVRDLEAEGMRDLAARLFRVYRQRRLESAAEYIVESISGALARQERPAFTLGRRGREWLAGIWSGLSVPWVPDALPADAAIDDRALDEWAWGTFTVEHIAEIVFDLFRRALIVAPLHSSAAGPLRERLRSGYAGAYQLLALLPRTRRNDEAFWAGCAPDVEAILAAPPGQVVERARIWGTACIARWRTQTWTVTIHEGHDVARRLVPDGEMPIQAALGKVASAMADLIAEAAGDLRAAAALGLVHGRMEADRVFAGDLRAYVDYLAPAGAASRRVVLSRLLTLEVVQYATGAYRDVPDQLVELVQISANVPGVLGGPTTAARKLAGAQLGNFGGFYKRAWRANDWMFGRLDGSDRLLRILLNPARLARLYSGDAAGVLGALKAIAIPPGADEATRAFLERHWRAREPGIVGELAFLRRPDVPVPEQLPHAVDALLARLHLSIVRDELPELVAAAGEDLRKGASPDGASAELVAAAAREIGSGGRAAWNTLPADRLARLFDRCRVGEERLAGEVATDLFATTLTRTIAVTATMISGARAGLGRVGRLLQLVRFPTLIVDALAQNIIRQSRTASFAAGAAVMFGALIIALDAFTGAEIATPLLNIAGLVLVSSVALLLWRHPRLVLVWVAAAVVTWGLFWAAPVLKEFTSAWGERLLGGSEPGGP